MRKTATIPKILLFATPDSRGREIVSRLGEDAVVRTVDSFGQAIAALREEQYDIVICDQASFTALERSAVDDHAAIILNTIGQGVCIIDPKGEEVWANPKMRSYPDSLISQISEVCSRSFGRRITREGQIPAHKQARRFSLTTEDEQYFEVTITPVVDKHDDISQFTAVVWDVTHSQRLQKKIDAIDLAGRELVELDSESMAGMNVEERVEMLEEKILRYMHDLLSFDNFAVLLLDKKTNRLEIVLQHGMSDKTGHLDIFASPENNGISGYVAATGRSYICHDTSKDPRYLQGLEAAKSSLTVPLRLHDEVIGVFDIESDDLAAFNEDDRQFAEILARSIALALHMLDLLILERYESTGRVADDVTDEIAGPLNDIVTEASTLIEEYLGKDDLRHRLNAIIDRVTEIKSKVRDVASPPGGIFGLHADAGSKDPALDGKRILVADDEKVICDTVAGVLKKSGSIVDIAYDGAEAIAKIQQQGYDLVLADIKMPLKNGYEVFAEAREIHPECGVILMTGFGYDPNHSIVRARKEGLSAVLFKPFKVEQLLAEIREALQPSA